jgi:hypothetical protein
MDAKADSQALGTPEKSSTPSKANTSPKPQDKVQGNRGRRAPRSGSGPVTGSGAGAGGGGNSEEYDDDLQV